MLFGIIIGIVGTIYLIIGFLHWLLGLGLHEDNPLIIIGWPFWWAYWGIKDYIQNKKGKSDEV